MRRQLGILTAIGLMAGLWTAIPAHAQVYSPGTVYYGTSGLTHVPPSPTSYATYGLPGNYFQPTYPSYMPYNSSPGAPYSSQGYPVPSITFTNPNGGRTTLVQSQVWPQPGADLYYNAGYPGHTAPRPFYSYNQTTYPTNQPSFPSYGPVNSGIQTGTVNLVPPSSASLPGSTGLGSPAFVGAPSTPGFVGAPPTPGFIGGSPIP